MPIRTRAQINRWCPILLSCLAVAAQAQDCAGLSDLAASNLGIPAATEVPAGGFSPPGAGRLGGFGAGVYTDLPAFCRIEAIARPAAGSAIGIEVWLPRSDWNGKLQGVGNGAWAGSISYSAMAQALAAGYAVASTDTGHRGNTPDFAREHPDKLIDFAYRAVHEMTTTAKALVLAYYGRPQARAYFAGCSTGGRQALTAAQRYPDDYDGIVAGAPAYYPSHIQGMQVWTAAVSNRSEAARLGPDEFGLLNAAALAACDTLDSVADGVIENPLDCDFDPGVLACPAAGGGACLDSGQVETARLIYQGPSTGNGASAYPGLAPGSESGWTTLSGDAPLSLARETYESLVYGDDDDWDWRDFDADSDIAAAVARIGPLMDANDPDIRDFVSHGGRLLLYHGWSDPGIPPAGTIRYFEDVQRTLGSAADESVRLFMVPGMGHCAGGTGTDRFDAVAALDAWIGTGAAPGRIEAARIVDGETVRSRPLCAFPSVAVYGGQGSTDDAASFSCR